MRLALIPVVLLAMAACSDEGGDRATALPTSAPATTTTDEPASTTTARPATTTSGDVLSRESKVAIDRCLDATGAGFTIEISLDGATVVDNAIALCEEASTQVSADRSGPGPVADLAVDIAQRIVYLTQTNVTLSLYGGLSADEATQLIQDLGANHDAIVFSEAMG